MPLSTLSPRDLTDPRIRQIDTRIKAACGCTEKFDSIAAAEQHAMRTGHTVTISGEVRVSKY